MFDVLIFISIFALAFVGVYLFVSIFVSYFERNKHNYNDDLPLDMIYKSEEEVKEYRKLHNIPDPNI